MAKDPIEQMNAALRGLVKRLTSSWLEIDMSQAERIDKTALYLLCWAGIVELRLHGRAWSDQTALDFEAIVCGVWIDRKGRSILPDGIRRFVPAWTGKAVAAELQPVLQVRLTSHGEQTKAHISADEFDVLFVAFVCMQHISGRAAVRIIGNEGPAPGAVRQDTVSGVEILAALRDMAETLKSVKDDTHRLTESVAALRPVKGGASRFDLPEVGENLFRHEGAFWKVVYKGEPLRPIKHLDGMSYIAHLLGHPDKGFTPVELIRAVRQDPNYGKGELLDSGEVLDEEGRAAVTLRIQKLQEQLEDKECPPDEVAELREEQAELQVLFDTATVPGGKVRKLGALPEQARVNVIKSVQRALEAISAAHPALGRFLGHAQVLKIGVPCVYRPPQDDPVAWVVSL